MAIDQWQSATTPILSNSHSDSMYALQYAENNCSMRVSQQLLDLAECLFYDLRLRKKCCPEINTVLLPSEA